MGTSRAIRYAIYVDNNFSGEWHTRRHFQTPGYGKPTNANLEKWTMHYARSLEPGGVNYHLSKAHGNVPYPRHVTVKDHFNGGKIVAEWKAGAFQIYNTNPRKLHNVQAKVDISVKTAHGWKFFERRLLRDKAGLAKRLRYIARMTGQRVKATRAGSKKKR